MKKSLGRLTYLHPSAGEPFYFQMLLCLQKGCKSLVKVQTVHDQTLPTYRAACQALGLLRNDKEWDITFEESTASASSAEIRALFAQILLYCDVSDPPKLFTKHWQAMRDDILGKISKAIGIPNYHVNTAELQGIAVIMEYLVNISKRRTFESLNEDILKIAILKTNTPYPSRRIRHYFRMDEPNMTVEEYIKLKEEKARRRGWVFNWQTDTYGKIRVDDDLYNLRSMEAEFPVIVIDDAFTPQDALP
ncbi:hypothetical protein Tco_0493010 [Tanacetum coccineum]